MSMDRLVELFLESARTEDQTSTSGPAFGGAAPDANAIEKGISIVEKMLTSEDAVSMGGSPSATFVLLGMALEEKPKLGEASIRCYEKGLEFLSRRTSKNTASWERCVVLQQLGAVCLRQGHLQAADGWLEECAQACQIATGHPRDADLFGGAFNTKQTRLEFVAAIEKWRVNVCVKLGDQGRAQMHAAEAKRLEAASTGDAVARQEALTGGQPAGATSSTSLPKDLWKEGPSEVRQLKEYQFLDEGPTVLVILDLNEHLGIGPEASTLVQTMRQFRVNCEANSLDIQLRVQRPTGEVMQFQLLLAPLKKEIIPEDTVPKLRGKETKRRLEVKLFKREKQQPWYGDLVADGPRQIKAEPSVAKGGDRSSKARPAAAVKEKGTMANPLTPEELARLPKPQQVGDDNRPSNWHAGRHDAATNGCIAPAGRTDEVVTTAGIPVDAPPKMCATTEEILVGARGATATPDWVSEVSELWVDKTTFELRVCIGPVAGETVGLEDLDLAVDTALGLLRLSLMGEARLGGTLELQVPEGVDLEGLRPRWRRRNRLLELQLPAKAA